VVGKVDIVAKRKNDLYWKEKQRRHKYVKPYPRPDISYVVTRLVLF